MSWFGGASKPQHLKKYGSVEKMYIHFYTLTHKDQTIIAWYQNNTENLELFLDIKHLLATFKGYGEISAYTGDIFCIKNIHKFIENLILLGATTPDMTVMTCNLTDGTSRDIKGGIIGCDQFNELFDICFEDYDFINSFSSDSVLSKRRIEVEVEDNATGPANNGLMMVTLHTFNYIIPYHKFNLFPAAPLKSKINNNTLVNWFNTLTRKQGGYTEAVAILLKLTEFNKEDDGVTEADGTVDDDNTTVATIDQDNKVNALEWMGLFCDLYLEEDKTSDILLSDMYQSYSVASGWTGTPIVSMAKFIKAIRNMNRFTIKRRSKGMMIIGYRCLVHEQERMYIAGRTGKSSTRQLVHYMTHLDLAYIMTNIEKHTEQIAHKYAREACVLLSSTSVPITYQSVAQFCAIPQIASYLPMYAEYLDKLIKMRQDMAAALKNNSKQPSPDQFQLEYFRDFAGKCVLYFPFNIKLYDSSQRNTFKKFPVGSEANSSNVTPFNEVFGMFATSKNYHLYRPEEGTPQDYNNQVGAPWGAEPEPFIVPPKTWEPNTSGGQLGANWYSESEALMQGERYSKEGVEAAVNPIRGEPSFLKPGALIGVNNVVTKKDISFADVVHELNSETLSLGTKLNENSSE
jgi:hypothetical protein